MWSMAPTNCFASTSERLLVALAIRGFDATTGVLASSIQLLADDATHVGVASDHTIESFRNELFNGYKDGSGMPPELAMQIPVMEDALGALGVTVWPMIEFEADDALASAAAVANADDRVGQVLIVTPDKDLGQCVVGDRVVQFDRRKGLFIDESGVNEKFGVGPASIADWLALGDTADGIPGLPGWVQSTSSVFPATVTLKTFPRKPVDGMFRACEALPNLPPHWLNVVTMQCCIAHWPL